VTDRCLECLGSRTSGYGQLELPGRQARLAHRFVWEWLHGPIPTGKIIMHECDNRACINPVHLRLGTKYDNTRDMWNKGRQRVPFGTSNGMARLTPAKVKRIRRRIARGEMLTCIARRFGVALGTIRAIRSGITWRHVPDEPPEVEL
jgi:hypothetical protein